VDGAEVVAHVAELARLARVGALGAEDGLGRPDADVAIAAGRGQPRPIGRDVAAVDLEVLLLSCGGRVSAGAHDDGDARAGAAARKPSQLAVESTHRNVPLWRSHEGLRIYMVSGSGQCRRHAHDGAEQWGVSMARCRGVEVAECRVC
jgi:hypothetical protein